MPSPRRVRLLMLAGVATFVFILFYSSGFSSNHDAAAHGEPFYVKTKEALSDPPEHPGQPVVDADTGKRAGKLTLDKDGDGDIDDEDTKHTEKMQERLKAAEIQAKIKANEKGGLKPDPPHEIIGVGSSAEGHHGKDASGNDADADASTNDKKDTITTNVKDTTADDKQAKITDEKDSSPGSKSPAKGKADTPAGKKGKTETAAEAIDDKTTSAKEPKDAKAELADILKKAPVVIFSKTYCPFSKRAKGLLLDKYTISPTPHVVELDEHPLGQQLQDELLGKTGRRTVPNILINGESIGGADDIVDLDNKDALTAKIRSLGNNLVEISERFITPGSEKQ